MEIWTKFFHMSKILTFEALDILIRLARILRSRGRGAGRAVIWKEMTVIAGGSTGRRGNGVVNGGQLVIYIIEEVF